jgi:hypothetical protein
MYIYISVKQRRTQRLVAYEIIFSTSSDSSPPRNRCHVLYNMAVAATREKRKKKRGRPAAHHGIRRDGVGMLLQRFS